MTKTSNVKTKTGAEQLIFLCWCIYTISYLAKVNYSANITQIIDFYKITKAEAGMAPTFFFFAYGIGQVVNGTLCKKYNIKWAVFISMILSATINLVVAVSTNFAIIKWVWLVNGFVLSILWPSLVRVLSETLPRRDLSRSSVIMGTTVAAGTLIIYGLSSLFAVFDNFKLAFYTASFAAALAALIWMVTYKKAISVIKSDEIHPETDKADSDKQKPQQKNETKKLLYTTIYILCFCAIGVNLIKDGLTTWIPAILKEEFFMSDSISILLTLFLPIVAIFGNLFALNLHKKVPDYVTHCAMLFAIMLGVIFVIIGSLVLKIAACMLIGVVVVNLLASSLNSLITSIFPIFMRDKVNSGLYAGVLNGFAYVGSTISSYGLGAIADNFGWIAVFRILIGFCIAVCSVWCIYVLYKHRCENNKAC